MDLEDLGLMVLIPILLFIMCILGTIVGAIVGWTIQVTPLSSLVYQGFEVFGISVKGKLVHVGATLGFVGGFFSSRVSSNRSSS